MSVDAVHGDAAALARMVTQGGKDVGRAAQAAVRRPRLSDLNLPGTATTTPHNSMTTEMRFNVSGQGEVHVTVVDTSTGRIVREIPPHSVLNGAFLNVVV